ncbi:MAG: hypothetical protein ACPGXY_03180 [Alphaproteobacteria bacterium]
MITNKQVVENWRHGINEHKQAGHLYHRDGVLYSYGEHYPLAVQVDCVVLINSRGYSVTTAAHEALVRRAFECIDIVYCPNIIGVSRMERPAMKAAIKHNQDEKEHLQKLLSRARAYGIIESYKREIQNLERALAWLSARL